MSPVFLDLSEVLAIHKDQIEKYGGSDGIRDIGLLESAVAQPEAGFGDEFLHKDIYEMVAAYLFHITQNHPFVDGNKRVGAMAAFTFLRMNELTLKASQDEYESLVRTVAEGKTDKTAIAEFFRKYAETS